MKTTAPTGKRSRLIKGFYLLPIMSNYLVYPPESWSDTITALSCLQHSSEGKINAELVAP